MEQGMISSHSRSGFMLVTVLIVTMVGLLFGAGALLLFKFQCQLRIDRQHELEKVYAVRSVLNYIRTPKNSNEIKDEGVKFDYHTGSDRDLDLIVKPVKSIFPDLSKSFPDNPRNHFIMEKGDFQYCHNQYNERLDYEYGAIGVTNIDETSITNGYFIGAEPNQKWIGGLAFKDLSATNNATWWVNIGMRDTGGWLQEEYGRRYYFYPREYVDGNNGGIKDTVSLCIIRNVTNKNGVGCCRGWPLSHGERALVFKITPMAGDKPIYDSAITISECWCEGAEVRSTNLVFMTHCQASTYMGIQVADDKVSAFYIKTEGLNENSLDPKSRDYTFSETKQMSKDTYDYFSCGTYTNNGRVFAPELRAVFVVEASSGKRENGGLIGSSEVDFITNFRVSPAYQYDVFLEYPNNVTNLATVAQKMGKYSRFGTATTILTYDTHGTENKGFRKDEKLAREGKK